jgi:tetratricopeptide (TPR) repeat protein/transcriptional regulator with XRE-family HTH domain
VFGELVRAHRRRLGLTQEQLAEVAGVSVRSVGKWESGRIAAPRLGTVQLLADTFGLAGAERETFCGSAVEDPGLTPAQLPPDPYGFTGRDDEVARLHALLDDAPPGTAHGVLISAVSGTAGVGKTALAVHWAHRVRDRFPDGQLYVNLRGFDAAGPPVPAGEALRGLLDGLGVAPQRVPEDLAARAALYRSVLAGRRMLILLDNAAGAEQVRPLLPGVPGGLVIVTSRDRLTGLAVADGARPVLLDVLTRAAARQLLARRIGADRVRAEPRAVEQIVTACARLPLALAVTAARAAANPGFPLSAVAGELNAARSRLDVLAGADPATDVRAVFSWSYRRLSPAAARLFRLLGLHPVPTVGAPAVASLVGRPAAEVRPLLTELCASNLVTEPVPGRFECHDLLRDYARDLAAETEQQSATLRLLHHYLHTAIAADQLFGRERQVPGEQPPEPVAGVTPEPIADDVAAMTWFGTERAALRATVDEALAAGRDLPAWWLARSMNTYYERRWDKRDWLASLQAGLVAARRSGRPNLEAVSQYSLGYSCNELGLLTESYGHLLAALELNRSLGHRRGAAMVHLNLGIVARKEGRYADALAEGGTALEIYRSLGARVDEARALNNMGWCHVVMGDYATALDYCRRAAEVHDAEGNRMGGAHSWDSVGMAHFRLGDQEQALAAFRRSLALFRSEHNRQYEAIVLSHIGDAERAAGDDRAARDAWRHALTILTELDHPDAAEVRAKLAVRIDAAGDGRTARPAS